MKTAGVLASLLRDGGLFWYSAIATLGAPYFLRRKRRLLQKGRSDSEFDWAHWTISFGDEADKFAQPGIWQGEPDIRQGEPDIRQGEPDIRQGEPDVEFAKPDSRVADAHGAHADAHGDAHGAGPRVAVMAASWGEVVTLAPLIEALKRERPDIVLVWSVQRREAIEAARAPGDEAVLPHPFDHVVPVSRWHARARPDLVVFYEQFDLPVLARSLWARRVPFVVVQARASQVANGYGYKRRLYTPAFWRWQLRGLGAMLLASDAHREMVAPLAPEEAQLRVVGSLKFPHDKPRLSPQREAELRAWITAGTAGAPLFVAGSTHAGEEAFVLDALEIVRRDCDDAAPVLLLAPRRLGRTDEVLRLLSERGLRVSRRSQPIAGAVDVLLLDTLGELGAAYAHAAGAFVGGTVNGASHNVAEPLVWGVPVAYGPRRGNFAVEQTLCEEAGVGFRVASPGELAAHWTALLDSEKLRRELGARAGALVEAQSAAFGLSLQTLVEAVDAVTPQS